MQAKSQKKKPGPPATGIGTGIQVRVQPDFLVKLDEWRRQQPDLPSRPEALRRLAEKALKK